MLLLSHELDECRKRFHAYIHAKGGHMAFTATQVYTLNY